MYKLLHKFGTDEGGASAAEYAVLLTILTTGVGAAVVLLGTNIGTVITTVAGYLLAPT
jgi:Flp pilus assembly pilin Flp